MPLCLVNLHSDLMRITLAPLGLRLDGDQGEHWHPATDPDGGLAFVGAPLRDPGESIDVLRPSDFYGSERFVDAQLLAFSRKWDAKLRALVDLVPVAAEGWPAAYLAQQLLAESFSQRATYPARVAPLTG